MDHSAHQLVFEAGRLLSVAEEQARRTTVALDALASPQTPQSEATEAGLTRESAPASTTHRARRPFDSPVLRNALRAYSPMHAERALVPSALSHPIASRRAQLLAPGGPLDVLALRAQRLVLTSYTLAAGASVAAYFSAALAESFGLAALALQPGTAGATALLAIAATAWRLQGGWTKAKRRFWKDWDRLASGLDYDLQVR